MALREFFRENKRDFLCIAVLLLLGLVPLLSFQEGKLLAGGDTNYPLFPSDRFSRSLHLWDRSLGTGLSNPWNVPVLFPYLAVLAFLERLGLSAIASQKLLLCSLFFIPGLSMYYLTLQLMRGRESRIAALTAGIFYMFNPYILLNWSAPDPVFLIAYAMLPIVFAFFVRGLHSERWLKGAVIFGLASLLFATGNLNTPFLVITFAILFAYLLFYLIREDQNRVRALKFSLASLIAYLSLNLWWLAPITLSTREAHGALLLAGVNLVIWLQTFSSYSTVVNLFRLFGYPGWASSGFTYSYSFVYDPLLVLLSFLFPLLAFGALLLNRKEKNVYFFAGLALVAIFIGKGVQEPFKGVFLWMYQNIPFFFIFRSPYVKLAIVIALAYAFLIGISVSSIHTRLKEKSKTAAACLVLLLTASVALFPWPFWTGEVVHTGQGEGAAPSFHIKIPDYYFEGSAFINSQSDEFRLLSLPEQGSWTAYKWGYLGVDLLMQTLQKQIIVGETIGSGEGEQMAHIVYTAFAKNSSHDIGKVLGLMNVKYILLRNDIDYTRFGPYPAERVAPIIETQKGIHRENTFGNLSFYRNDCLAPYIYAAKGATYVEGGISALIPLASSEGFDPQRAYFFSALPGQEEHLNLSDGVAVYADVPSNVSYYIVNASDYLSWERKARTNYTFSVPREGRYTLYARFKDADLGSPLAEIGKYTLTPGNHSFQFSGLSKPEDIENTLLISEYTDGFKIPKIEFEKPDPTTNIVRVTDATEPFVLVYGESYHPGWRAFVGGDEVRHFLVNGYANGYYIDRRGDYTVRIEFTPQRVFARSLHVSLLALSLCLLFLFGTVIRDSRRKGE